MLMISCKQMIHYIFNKRPLSSIRSFSILGTVAFPQTQESIQLNTIKFGFQNNIAQVSLNRPMKGNSFDMQMWKDYIDIFRHIEVNKEIRVVVLNGEGKHFSTGMDLSVFAEMRKVCAEEPCEGRRREGISRLIQFLQDAVSAPEKCKVPVIASISGHCIGGAVDLISACDLRFCTEDATFCIKETDLGMVADIGTLQRLPKLISEQRVRELVYTGRVFGGKEAAEFGFALQCFPTKETLDAHVTTIAKQIAEKSPLTIRGIKKTVLYSRDHTVEDSLNQVKNWNSAYLFSDDLVEAMRAAMVKEKPLFK